MDSMFSELALVDGLLDGAKEMWVLGHRYELDKEGVGRTQFLRDFERFIWMTYRMGFVPIAGTHEQSDNGWGCMLRCGQMLLAQAMLINRLGENWSSSPDLKKTRREIIKLFLDHPSRPYSLHNITTRGSIVKKAVCEWLGPNAVAQVLKSLMAEQPDAGMVAHIAMDSCLCTESVVKLCSSGDGSWTPLLLMVPLRLGLDKLNPAYIKELERVFTLKGTLGAIGGKPNSAYYFVGRQGSDVVYFDPHTLQHVISDVTTEHSVESYSCTSPGYIPLSSLDPSLCVAFFCKTRQDFDELISQFKERPVSHPLFTVIDREPTFDMPDDGDFDMPEGDESVDGDGSDDDFEIISMPSSVQHL